MQWRYVAPKDGLSFSASYQRTSRSFERARVATKEVQVTSPRDSVKFEPAVPSDFRAGGLPHGPHVNRKGENVVNPSQVSRYLCDLAPLVRRLLSNPAVTFHSRYTEHA
ncbi:hypothetical protein RRG08_039880 [Elysia crispata]|uniref:Uncharacterized protein n=1 Tax=Elysia crispata TaxID=231223 RepID=A0AAE0ZWP6_9GAST|nr:hypothetical protein RRG08_039880 [Elysia crispata]